MKTVSITEAQANLEYYGRLCREEIVIVTMEGEQSFRLVPIEEDDDDDLVDRLIETNAEFRKLLESRLSEKSISVEEALRRLES